MAVIKTKYEQTKICDTPLVKEMTSSQEIFSIKSIDESGIFELNNKMFSKLYVLSDINFAGVTDVIVRYRKEKRSKTRYAPQKGKRHENNESFI